MTFQQDDLCKKDNSFGVAAGFVAEIDGSFPGKAPQVRILVIICRKWIFFST